MNTKQAHKQAAKDSKDGAARYVVYVFDEGSDVYNADQARTYAPLIIIEAAYLNGVQIASQEVTA
jgi:hypothetical protein